MMSAAPALLAMLMSVAPSVAPPTLQRENWLVGAWQMTHDEDGTPADIMEFRADGTHVFWGAGTACTSYLTEYHVHSGNVYVTVEVPGKGPIAAIFRPDQERTKLVFTSPRTRNNATYERILDNPCN